MSEVKVCRKCGLEKSLDQFTFKRRKSGNKTPRSWCRDCSYVYRRAYYATTPEQKSGLQAANRHQKAVLSAYLESVKKAPCVDCGGSFPHYVMDFDHRDPSEKSGNVATFRRNGVSLEKLKDEVAKCDLVCSNCHRIRTHVKVLGPDTYTALT